MDYAHFAGNETPLAYGDPTSSFRMLDYYRYSTAENFLSLKIAFQA